MNQDNTHPGDLQEATAAPTCPICESADPVVLYGYQDYLVGDGAAPSRIYRCRSCDFNFRRFDRPLHEIVNHFQVAPYSSDEIEEQWLQRRKGFYEFLLDMLPGPAAGQSLLDIGCAFGHFLHYAEARGYQPFGTEVSEAMAELTRKRRNYPVSSRPLDDLQLPVKTFDVITLVDSFYYFEDPLTVLRQCRQLLNPGGQLLMRVTNRNQMARAHRLPRALTFRWGPSPQMPFWTTDDAISCHSRKSITRLMDRTGFQIQKLTCLERGKKMESLGMRMFYRMTSLAAKLTAEAISWTPGVVCLATGD